jgi:DNA primase
MIPQSTQTFTPERQPYTLTKAIEAVKDAVSIEDVAAEYGAFKRAGAGRLLGRCIAPDHADRTPSMMVYPDSQKFRCYGCGLRGDVVDLEEIGGRHIETWTAVVALAERYGVKLPRRSERWHEWTNDKDRRRRMIRDAVAAGYQRRYFRVYGGYLQEIRDPAERKDEAQRLFDDLRPIALAAAEKRMSR